MGGGAQEDHRVVSVWDRDRAGMSPCMYMPKPADRDDFMAQVTRAMIVSSPDGAQHVEEAASQACIGVMYIQIMTLCLMF